MLLTKTQANKSLRHQCDELLTTDDRDLASWYIQGSHTFTDNNFMDCQFSGLSCSCNGVPNVKYFIIFHNHCIAVSAMLYQTPAGAIVYFELFSPIKINYPGFSFSTTFRTLSFTFKYFPGGVGTLNISNGSYLCNGSNPLRLVLRYGFRLLTQKAKPVFW